MNPVDSDEVVDVPDTPDRLVKRMINGRSGVKEEIHGSHIPFHVVQQKFCEKGTEVQPPIMESGSRKLSVHTQKCTSSYTNTLGPLNSAAPSIANSSSFKNNPRSVVIDNGSRRQHSHSPKCASSSGNSLHPINSAGFSMASSFSSKSPLLFRKQAPTVQSDDSSHTPHLRIEKPSFSYKYHSSSSFQDHDFVDLTEMSLHSPECGQALPGGTPGSGQFECSRRSALSNGASSLKDLLKSTVRSGANEGTDNMTEVFSSNGYGQQSEFVDNARNKPGDDDSLRHESIVSPRVNRQKRLVRNGCISPNNIAKANQLAGKRNSCFGHDNNDAITSGGPSVPFVIRELVSEGHNSHNRKGKGVITYPCTSKDPEIKNKNLPSRSSSSSSGKAIETSEFIRGSSEHIEESGEWRNTRNRQGLQSSSTDEEQFIKREMDVPRYANQHNEKMTAKREKGSGVATDDGVSKVPNLVSSEHVSTLPLRQSISLPRARLGQLNRYPSANALIKRQKQGTTSSYSGECSTSVSDDSEVVIFSSSTANSRSTSRDVANLHQTIGIGDFKPSTYDEVARAKQVEADELLARELQEQLYNDLPVLGVRQVDTNVATVLEHQDNSNPLSTRGSLMSDLRRQSQSRSSSNLLRRGSQSRAPTLGRMTRLRSRFPGQPRTLLPSGGRTSLFPANMDVETRMHILGTLEAFSDMEVGTGNLMAHRDFNENDYETLLALDENNDHGGASVHQINGLPQSTVQRDNFDEVCAICLETPTIGDTIRHLPCLHKFHKDCIDPWLRRRTLCPVCKSAIT